MVCEGKTRIGIDFQPPSGTFFGVKNSRRNQAGGVGEKRDSKKEGTLPTFIRFDVENENDEVRA